MIPKMFKRNCPNPNNIIKCFGELSYIKKSPRDRAERFGYLCKSCNKTMINVLERNG